MSVACIKGQSESRYASAVKRRVSSFTEIRGKVLMLDSITLPPLSPISSNRSPLPFPVSSAPRLSPIPASQALGAARYPGVAQPCVPPMHPDATASIPRAVFVPLSFVARAEDCVSRGALRRRCVSLLLPSRRDRGRQCQQPRPSAREK